jgi:ribosomal protein L22
MLQIRQQTCLFQKSIECRRVMVFLHRNLPLLPNLLKSQICRQINRTETATAKQLLNAVTARQNYAFAKKAFQSRRQRNATMAALGISDFAKVSATGAKLSQQ